MPDLITVFSPAAGREFHQVPWPNESKEGQPWTITETIVFINNWWVAALGYVRALDTGDAEMAQALMPGMIAQRDSARFIRLAKAIKAAAAAEHEMRVMGLSNGPAPSGRSVLSLRGISA